MFGEDQVQTLEKVFLLIFLSLICLCSVRVTEADDKIEAANALASALNIEESIAKMRQEVFEPQIATDPQFAEYRVVIGQFYARYMSFESLKAEIAALLGAEFSVDEMRQIAAFYDTPAGKKASRSLTPTLAKINLLVYEQGHKHLGDLKKLIKDELNTVSPDLELKGNTRGE